MSRLAFGILVAVAAAWLAPSVAGNDDMDGCYIDGQRGIIDCSGQGGRGGDGGGGNQNPWTGDTAQVIYTVLTVAGSGAGSLFLIARRRKRRGELRTFMADVEGTFAAAKVAPDEGLPKLDALRKGLQASHDAGRIEDAQFLELDKRVADFITRVRMLQVERWFPNLPIALVSEIRTLISDGHFSTSDLSLIEKRAINLEVAPHVRQALETHLKQWARRDEDTHPVGQAPFVQVKRRIAVIARK